MHGIKCQIICLMEASKSQSHIGNIPAVSKRCVQQTKKHYNGFVTITDQPRAGCPRKTSPKQDHKLFQLW